MLFDLAGKLLDAQIEALVLNQTFDDAYHAQLVSRSDIVDSISYIDNNFGDPHHTRKSISFDKVKITIGNGRQQSMIAAVLPPKSGLDQRLVRLKGGATWPTGP
jgi:hypothetical protein